MHWQVHTGCIQPPLPAPFLRASGRSRERSQRGRQPPALTENSNHCSPSFFSGTHWAKDVRIRRPWPTTMQVFDRPVRAGGGRQAGRQAGRYTRPQVGSAQFFHVLTVRDKAVASYPSRGRPSRACSCSTSSRDSCRALASREPGSASGSERVSLSSLSAIPTSFRRVARRALTTRNFPSSSLTRASGAESPSPPAGWAAGFLVAPAARSNVAPIKRRLSASSLRRAGAKNGFHTLTSLPCSSATARSASARVTPSSASPPSPPSPPSTTNLLVSAATFALMKASSAFLSSCAIAPRGLAPVASLFTTKHPCSGSLDPPAPS
ncbi:hypothetical protein T484DRAFT_2304147, partial [Baffinella frigidus]